MSDHELTMLHRDNAIRTFENDKLLQEVERLRQVLGEVAWRDDGEFDDIPEMVRVIAREALAVFLYD